MDRQSSDARAERDRRLERAIILVLLSEDDGRRQWSRAELSEGMGVSEDALNTALAGLLEAGVLQGEGDRVWPSPATRRLDRLELVGV
jgi:DNA-binding Lrp family transcriptional regulator